MKSKERNAKWQTAYQNRLKKKIRKKPSYGKMFAIRLIICLVVFGCIGVVAFDYIRSALQGVLAPQYVKYPEKTFNQLVDVENYAEGGRYYLDLDYNTFEDRYTHCFHSADILLTQMGAANGYWGIYNYETGQILREMPERTFLLPVYYKVDDDDVTIVTYEIAPEQVEVLEDIFITNDPQRKLAQSYEGTGNVSYSYNSGYLGTYIYPVSLYVKGSTCYVESYKYGMDGEVVKLGLGDMSSYAHFEFTQNGEDKEDAWAGADNQSSLIYGSDGTYEIASKSGFWRSGYKIYSEDNEVTEIDPLVKTEAIEKLRQFMSEKVGKYENKYETYDDERFTGKRTYAFGYATVGDTHYGFVFTYGEDYSYFIVPDLIGIICAVLILAHLIAVFWAIASYNRRKALYEIYGYRTMVTNTLAHDLKSPLMAISGYVDNLAEDTHPDKRDHYLQGIAGKVTYMNTLIENTLDLAKAEEGVVKNSAEFEVLPYIEELRDVFSEKLKEKNLAVDVTGSLTLKCDEQSVKTALRNLFENAVKYGKSGSSIDITLRRTEICFVNSVDKPVSTDPKKLTQAFVRDDEARGEDMGTGLGLAIVKTVCDAHGYRLAIDTSDNSFKIVIKI